MSIPLEQNVLCNMLLAMMQHIPDSIYFKDRQGRFLYVSAEKANHCGKNSGEMIGKTDYDFMPEEEARVAYADDVKVMETGEPIINKEEKRVRSDGTEIWNLVTKVPWRDEQGQIVGLIGVSRDITERVLAEKEALEAKQQLTKINKRLLNLLRITKHDIRYTMSSIMAGLKLIQKVLAGAITPTIKLGACLEQHSKLC